MKTQKETYKQQEMDFYTSGSNINVNNADKDT